jgi:hypothetical protein
MWRCKRAFIIVFRLAMMIDLSVCTPIDTRSLSSATSVLSKRMRVFVNKTKSCRVGGVRGHVEAEIRLAANK